MVWPLVKFSKVIIIFHNGLSLVARVLLGTPSRSDWTSKDQMSTPVDCGYSITLAINHSLKPRKTQQLSRQRPRHSHKTQQLSLQRPRASLPNLEIHPSFYDSHFRQVCGFGRNPSLDRSARSAHQEE